MLLAISSVNAYLKKQNKDIRYKFNFLTPTNFNGFFQSIRDGGVVNFRSLLDVELAPKKSDLFFSDVIPEGEDHEKWLPVYTYAAACGKFTGSMQAKEEKWMYVGRKFDDQHFVVCAVGHSMEPKIKDGDYCIFKANPAGPYTGQGRIYLFQYQGEPDPDTGGSYTIKGYRSHKGKDGFNARVELLPRNKKYSPIEFRAEDGDIDQKLHFVAEFVENLKVGT